MTVAPHPTTIDGVVDVLDAIIDDCVRARSRMGYFAALYRRVTVEVRRRVEANTYVDSERMERLDVAFAQRYIDAYVHHRSGERPTDAWAHAFAAVEDEQPIIMQHLLLGMNAHINLDLGIAAGEIMECHATEGFRDDFDGVNAVLRSLIDEVQDELSTSSGWMAVLDTLGGRLDEAACHFCLARARSAAWRRACAWHTADASRRRALLREFDRYTCRVGRRIYTADSALGDVLAHIRAWETDDVRAVIERLR